MHNRITELPAAFQTIPPQQIEAKWNLSCRSIESLPPSASFIREGTQNLAELRAKPLVLHFIPTSSSYAFGRRKYLVLGKFS
ncbi:hypothetical protein R1flu_024975 [Riccia fluitans]|uniref:Uncharacterized protein n=1 Tax=Riccia fluitans TaxID=41844 RepID=A0ABD1XWF6_9MARC